MKRLEEMSREELKQEIIANSKHLKEIEAAHKESEHRRAELEKAQKSISNAETEMSKAIPYLQELLNMKDQKITKLQNE